MPQHKIAPKTQAREQIACLGRYGTSIIELANHIAAYLKTVPEAKTNPNSHNLGYCVVRSEMTHALTIIAGSLWRYRAQSQRNGGVIFKMYTKKPPDNKTEFLGHTVAIISYKNILCYVDPQASKIIEIKPPDMNSLLIQINSAYGYDATSGFKFADFMLTVRPSAFDLAFMKDLVLSDLSGLTFLNSQTSLTGGRKLTGKKKRRCKTKIRRKKSTRHGRRRSVKRTRKRGGNYGPAENDDPFVQAMLKADKEAGIPTVLSNYEI